jgi:hypothetical protein
MRESHQFNLEAILVVQIRGVVIGAAGVGAPIAEQWLPAVFQRGLGELVYAGRCSTGTARRLRPGRWRSGSRAVSAGDRSTTR